MLEKIKEKLAAATALTENFDEFQEIVAWLEKKGYDVNGAISQELGI